MHYVKSLLINFILIFFADYLLPGVEVMDQTKLPHIGGDLLFPLILGLINSLIFPCLRMMDRHLTAARIAMISLVLNFAAYALLKLTPIAIQVTTVEGYLLAALVVSSGSFITNYLELKKHRPEIKPPL